MEKKSEVYIIEEHIKKYNESGKLVYWDVYVVPCMYIGTELVEGVEIDKKKINKAAKRLNKEYGSTAKYYKVAYKVVKYKRERKINFV